MSLQVYQNNQVKSSIYLSTERATVRLSLRPQYSGQALAGNRIHHCCTRVTARLALDPYLTGSRVLTVYTVELPYRWYSSHLARNTVVLFSLYADATRVVNEKRRDALDLVETLPG
jgi:hypothetical protein